MPPNRGIMSGRAWSPGAAEPPPPSHAASPPATGSLLRAAFYLTALYVFLFASRSPELMGIRLRPMVVLAVALLGAALLSGRLLAVLETRSGWLVVIFAGWLAFVTPFSRWRGGSAQVVIAFLKTLLVLVIMTALVQSVRDSLRLSYTVGFAMGAAALMGILVGTEAGGRLEVDVAGGTLGDPNFFCLYILTGLPLLWLQAKHASWIGKILPLSLGLLILWSALRTASRSGLVAFVAGMLFLFWHIAPRQKMKLLVVGAVVGAVLLIAAPQAALRRLTTWFELDEIPSAQTEEEQTSARVAVESAESRRYLFWQSVLITLKNPLVGVGPGMFMEAEAEKSGLEGHRGAWHGTHNMYTQVSSETGIPGLVLFLWLLGSVYHCLTRTRKLAAAGGGPQHQLVRDAALYLQVALVIVLVDGLFLNITFGGPLYILAGLALGLEAAVRREWAGLPVPAGKVVRE